MPTTKAYYISAFVKELLTNVKLFVVEKLTSAKYKIGTN
jgi:hypothetical protein